MTHFAIAVVLLYLVFALCLDYSEDITSLFADLAKKVRSKKSNTVNASV